MVHFTFTLSLHNANTKLCKFIQIFSENPKQNTPIHDELAYDLYNELKSCDQHTKQYRKSIALVAAMRLKRHKPNESLEILSIYDDIDVNIRYVRILSYTYLNQFDEVLRLLEITVTSTADQQTIPKIPDQLVKRQPKKQKINFEEKIKRLTNCFVCVFFCNSYKKSKDN